MTSNDNAQCKIQGCIGKWLLSALLVFIFIAVAEYLIHAVWLKPLYQQTASLWRSEEEIKQLCPLMLGYEAILAIIVTKLYRKSQKATVAVGEGECAPCPVKRAVCFGMIIGLLFGVMHAATYIWMPIPAELAIKWLIAGVLEGLGIGVILSFSCGKKAATK